MTAFATAGVAPIVPCLTNAFDPSAFTQVGVSMTISSKDGSSVAVIAAISQRAGQRIPSGVAHPLQERLRGALGDAAVPGCPRPSTG